MNIIVTGSAGFLGSDLVPRLQALGHCVIGVDRRPEQLSRVPIQHDLRERFAPEVHARLVELRPQVCIHLASAVGGFLYNLSRQQLPEIQKRIDETVVELCSGAGCERLIFTSTINVFEVSGQFQHGPLGQHDQRSHYAVAKAAAERRLESAFAHLTVLRPTNIYGKHQPRRHAEYGESHVIPDLLAKLEANDVLEVLGDGSQRRNFVHASDISGFIITRLQTTGQHHLNLRSDLSLSIGELARQLIDLSGRSYPIRYRAEFMQHELFQLPDFDTQPARAQGWSPRIHTLQEGLTR